MALTIRLYVSNLPEKLRKVDLRISLYTLFSTYGTVLDVVAMPSNKMRGQAWIAFRDVQASTQAMRSLQGMDFFGRSLKITYAKGKSHAIAKLDGTYKPVTPAATTLQQQIFANPAAGLPSKPGTAEEETPQGTKRPHEDEEMEDGSDAPMEEDSDDD